MNIDLRKAIASSALPLAAAALIFGADLSFGKPPHAPTNLTAEDAPKRGPVNVDKEGVAIQGFDAVAYFTESKAVKGDAKFSAAHDGAKYNFASAANLETFNKDPHRYIPAYGGYCGYGVAKGGLAKIDPTAFQIVDGRLIMQYNADAMKEFNENLQANVARANENWKKLEAKLRK